MPAEPIVLEPQSLHAEAMPSVMITMPFNPKMTDKRVIETSLNVLIEKAKDEMEGRYPRAHVAKVYQRLTRLARQLEYTTHKISLAVLASPDFQKVYYFDFPVKEEASVADRFSFRELAQQKALQDKFLVLTLTESRIRICLADHETLNPMLLGHPPYHITSDVAADPAKAKQARLDQFILSTDQSLDIILSAYPYPLVVMGTEVAVGRFEAISRHSSNITEMIAGNFDDSSPTQILIELNKQRIDTQLLRQQYNLRRLKVALASNKLCAGIQECSTAANMRNARLLVVERGYQVTTFITPNASLSEVAGMHDESSLVVKDLVDATIEKVLQAGGEVEFVNDGALSEHMHMALVKLY